MHAFAEQGVEQARKTFDQIMAATRQAISSFEGHTAAAQSAARELQQQAMGFAERNITASFEFAQTWPGPERRMRWPRPMPNAKFVAEQMRALAGQAREMASNAGKAATQAETKLTLSQWGIPAAPCRHFCALQYLCCNAISGLLYEVLMADLGHRPCPPQSTKPHPGSRRGGRSRGRTLRHRQGYCHERCQLRPDQSEEQACDLRRHRTPKFEIPRFDLPKFEMPKLEIPAAFREFAEKGVNQAKDNWEKMKAATEEATDLIEDSYATASKGAADYGLKMIEAARVNTNAYFDFAGQMLTVKSLSEAVELSTAHMRKQFDALAGQTKELTALAQKVATETAEPIKESVTSAFKKVA